MHHVLTNVDIIFNEGLMDQLTMISVSSWPSSMKKKVCIFLMSDNRTKTGSQITTDTRLSGMCTRILSG